MVMADGSKVAPTPTTHLPLHYSSSVVSTQRNMLSSVLVSALALAGSVQAAPFFGGKAAVTLVKRAEVDDATNKAATQISEVQIQ